MLSKASVVLLAIISLTAGVAGCAAQRPASLDRARTSLLAVEQNPIVAQQAPSYLSDAQATLGRAEQEWANEHDPVETSHLAYVSEQQAGIALAVAQQKV